VGGSVDRQTDRSGDLLGHVHVSVTVFVYVYLHPVVCIISYGYDGQHNHNLQCLYVNTTLIEDIPHVSKIVISTHIKTQLHLKMDSYL
jgi:hypothetical protein